MDLNDHHKWMEVVDSKGTEDYHCLLCLQLCTNPVSCTSCGRLMCAECASETIARKMPCPMKCSKSTLLCVNEDPRARRDIGNVKVRCLKCKVEVEYRGVIKHLASCVGYLVDCAVPHCKFRATSAEMEVHVNNSLKEHYKCLQLAINSIKDLVCRTDMARKMLSKGQIDVKDATSLRLSSSLNAATNGSSTSTNTTKKRKLDDGKNPLVFKTARQFFIESETPTTDRDEPLFPSAHVPSSERKKEEKKKRAELSERWKNMPKEEQTVFVQRALMDRIMRFGDMGFSVDECGGVLSKEKSNPAATGGILESNLRKLLQLPVV